MRLINSAAKRNKVILNRRKRFKYTPDYDGNIKSGVALHQFSRASYAITTPEKLYIFDGGTTEESKNTAKYYKDTLGYDEIEAIFLSHYHNHHIGGIPGIIEYYYNNNGNVNNIYTSGYKPPSGGGWDKELSRMQEMENLIMTHNINYEFLKSGDELQDNNISINIINPIPEVMPTTQPGYFEHPNDYNGLCVLFKYGNCKLLMLGDIVVNKYITENEFWFKRFTNELNKVAGNTKINILQIPHHGDSRFTKWEKWWYTFSPDISLMDNSASFTASLRGYLNQKLELTQDRYFKYLSLRDSDTNIPVINGVSYKINLFTDGTFYIEEI